MGLIKYKYSVLQNIKLLNTFGRRLRIIIDRKSVRYELWGAKMKIHAESYFEKILEVKVHCYDPAESAVIMKKLKFYVHFLFVSVTFLFTNLCIMELIKSVIEI